MSTVLPTAPRSRFHYYLSLALVGFVVLGFARSYYLRILAIDPPILSTLLHVHAVVFTIWMALFIVQARLVSARRIDLHRRLGATSVVFAVLVFVVGVLSAFETSISQHVSPSGLKPAQFSIIPFTSILLFGAFIALGVTFRRRPGLHRRYMILGFIASISPASGRIIRLLGMQEYRDYLIPSFAAIFIAACIAYDWKKHRVVHPVYAIGGLVIIASWPLRLMIGRSDWYFPIGEGVATLARRMFA